MINDFERFVLLFFDVMKQLAMHIYHSALPWTPASSIIRGLYENELTTEARLLNAIDTTWPACVRVIPTEDPVMGIEFSPSGTLIAVTGSRTLTIYDTMTGMSFAEYRNVWWKCGFSPDNSLIVSGLDNGTVHVRDLQPSENRQEWC